MPSNHAQFMGFFAVLFSLWSLRCWGVSRPWRHLAVAALVGSAAIVGVSRIYLNYHDTPQVVHSLCFIISFVGHCWLGRRGVRWSSVVWCSSSSTPLFRLACLYPSLAMVPAS